MTFNVLLIAVKIHPLLDRTCIRNVSAVLIAAQKAGLKDNQHLKMSLDIY